MTPALPWPALARPLTGAQRGALARWLRAMLAFRASLTRWPALPSRAAPDATPFVTLYARGRVRGCFGDGAGTPGQRAARAFLRASSDSRFGSAGASESLHASISYAIRPRGFARGLDARDTFEVGTHGAVMLLDDAPPVVLLPQVAGDGGLDADAFLGALARKAGLHPDAWRDERLVLFEAETVGSRDAAVTRGTNVALATAWLAGLVSKSGVVRFAVDPRTGATTKRGPMFHGRAATVVMALERAGDTRTAARARAWLARETRAALRGDAPEAWPDTPAAIAGTLALVALAGVDVRAPLAAFVREAEGVDTSAWHAGQVALALGRDAPDAVWHAATRTRQKFLPWTLLAARAHGRTAVARRTEADVAAHLRDHAPHEGGAEATTVPETALTAIAVEALAGCESAAAKRAVERGRAFLTRWQLVPGAIPASLDPAVCLGAFPASPVHPVLRCDITAHAVLALLAP